MTKGEFILWKYWTLLPFLVMSSSSLCQPNLDFRNYLGLTFFELEANSETLNDNLEAKFITGLSYERRVSTKWSFLGRIDYSENIIRDYCHNCADAINGIGQMREFDAYLGIKRTYRFNNSEKWSWSTELDTYYSWLTYTGDFEGGFFGGNQIYYAYRHAWGGALRIGLNYYPLPRIVLSLSTSYRLGYGWYYHPSAGSLDNDISGAITFPELRFGFLF